MRGLSEMYRQGWGVLKYLVEGTEPERAASGALLLRGGFQGADSVSLGGWCCRFGLGCSGPALGRKLHLWE